MHYPLPLPLLMALCWFLPASFSHGQTIYRCGNSYSQSPCPGAASLDVADTRTAAQKAEADAATAAAARSAAIMEKERLARERGVPARTTEKVANHQAKGESAPPGGKGTKKTKPPAPYFIAAVPTEKPKEKAQKAKEKAGSKTAAATP